MPSLLRLYRLLLFGLLSAGCLALASAQAAPAAAAADMELVKKSLLEDPLFLSHLRDKISADSLNPDIIHQYLLKNPGVLAEMQEALAAQANQPAQNAAEQAKLLKDNAQILYHRAGDYVLGDKNAKITVLEFFDYNCGYCKRDFPQEQALVAAHKNVKIIMKDYPILSDDSIQAHLIAQAVRKLAPVKYPAFHEKMMVLQGRATKASALAIARNLGLESQALEAQMHNPDTQEAMLQSAQIAYKLGINYAPLFILGDKVLGAVTVPALTQAVIEAEKAQSAGK